MENLCDESNRLVRFFCAMCEDERARFAEERLHFFRKNGSRFETLSIIFKYLSESQREQVLTAVLNRELQDGTEILSFFHFFRFSIRALDEKNQKRLLQKLESITDERYRATVQSYADSARQFKSTIAYSRISQQYFFFTASNRFYDYSEYSGKKRHLLRHFG